MTSVHVVRGSGKLWPLTILALASAALLAGLWWHHQEEPSVQQAVAPAPASTDLTKDKPTASTIEPQAGTQSSMEIEQAAAAKEIERQPTMKPIKGPIKERPAFVSDMEWQMLKGVSQQNATPDAELTRLVNKLRFMKQLELWQSLEHSTDLAKRKALAEQLLDELPQRVASTDLDKPEAQKLQLALIKDAVSDEAARRQRAEAEARRLVAPAAN